MVEKSIFSVVNILAPSFLIRSSSFLEVTRITITSWMSSNFSEIQPLTAELAALEWLKKSIFSVVATLASSFLIRSSSFLQVTRITITSWMSLSFIQIQPLTAELAALEWLKNQYLVLSTL